MKYLFKMECISNLHVGNGETNYNIIDNEVQKDIVLDYVPIIHASGVKGSLRQFFSDKWGKTDERVQRIFGSDKNETAPGQYKFFDAKMIARPLRVSEGHLPYLLATDKHILTDFSDFLAHIGMADYYQYRPLKISEKDFFSDSPMVQQLEGFPVKQQSIPALETIIGKDYAVGNSIQPFALPVHARNKLDDAGISENLWYEEIVPYKSIFYFTIFTPPQTPMEFNFENEIIQFGGNASIGQGYTKITQVYAKEEA